MTPYVYLLMTRIAQFDTSELDNVPNKGIDPNDTSFISDLRGNVLEIVFGALGAISVLIITIAALQYVLAAGDPQKTAKAKSTIIYAVIGLVVSLLAFAIVRFVFQRIY